MITIYLEPDTETDKHNKIHIIKLVRHYTGLGLKDSKQIVDDMFDGITQKIYLSEHTRDSSYIRECIEEFSKEGVNAYLNDEVEKQKDQLKEKIKECIHICTDIEETETLEVLSVAFGMLK